MGTPMPREASGFMTYPNNCVAGLEDAIAAGRPFGPTGLGEWMWPVSAEYNAESDTTRVGFTLVPPPDAEVPS